MDTIQVALLGQPNVGKSTLFSRLTGVGVISSNYPGTTVEFDEGTVTYNDKVMHVHDLPGTYSLSVNSDDEKVVLDMLRDEENDVIVVVADGTNLESSLVLAIEVSELGLPMIMALNKNDLASRRYDVDIKGLSNAMGMPVIPVSSKTGEGVDDLLKAISDGEARVSDYRVMYDGHILKYVEELMAMDQSISWGLCIKMLEGAGDYKESASEPVRERIEEMNEEFVSIHGEGMNVHLARDRYGDAHIIAMTAMVKKEEGISKKERFSEMTITPSTGIPILLAVLIASFACLIFIGGYLAELIDQLYSDIVGTALSDFGRDIGGD